jgi:glycine cleavage system H protein
MSEIPGDLKYTAEHEWVRLEGDVATIGITDYAQDQLGEIIYLELPAVGKTLEAMAVMAVVESVKAASDIYAPVPGEVVAVNQRALDDNELVNKSPYGDGWLVKIRVADTSDVDALLTPEAYAGHAKE